MLDNIVSIVEGYQGLFLNTWELPHRWANKARESRVGVTPACGGVAVLPAPHSLEVGRVSSEMAEVSDSRCVVWRQYPRPNATASTSRGKPSITL